MPGVAWCFSVLQQAGAENDAKLYPSSCLIELSQHGSVVTYFKNNVCHLAREWFEKGLPPTAWLFQNARQNLL